MIRANRARVLVLVCAAFAVAPPSSGARAADGSLSRTGEAELLVSGAASLADALPAVGKAWEVAGGERLIFNFAASSTLVSQVEAGAPVDVVFTADEETLARLERGGLLLDGTRRTLLANRLAVVVPAGSELALAAAADLARPELRRLALADPTAVPAGKYARKWLEVRGVWSAVERRVVPTLNVRAALAAVAAGEADAGVVYATDAAADVARGAVELRFAVPAAEGPRIVYPAAVVGTSKRPEAARRLIDFLGSSEAAAIFARFGFAPPTP